MGGLVVDFTGVIAHIRPAIQVEQLFDQGDGVAVELGDIGRYGSGHRPSAREAGQG